MTSSRPKRVQLVTPDTRQAPFLEYHPETCLWRVWTDYNPSITSGTYLEMYPSGQCDCVSIGPDGAPRNIVIITGPVE